MVRIYDHEAEATQEDEENVGVAEDTVHIISHIVAEVSLMSRGVLWVLVVAPMEDIGVTVVVVVLETVEIIPVVKEIIGNMVVDMIVKMANGDQVRKSMIIGVKIVAVAVDLLLRGALDTSIDNTDHVEACRFQSIYPESKLNSLLVAILMI
jgi:hypothetical protein